MRIDPKAVEELRTHQTQLDMDGVMVGVSREALEHILSALVSPPDHGGGEGELCKPYVKRNAPGHAMDGGEVVVPFRSDFEMECILSLLDRASLPTQESEDGR